QCVEARASVEGDAAGYQGIPVGITHGHGVVAAPAEELERLDVVQRDRWPAVEDKGDRADVTAGRPDQGQRVRAVRAGERDIGVDSVLGGSLGGEGGVAGGVGGGGGVSDGAVGEGADVDVIGRPVARAVHRRRDRDGGRGPVGGGDRHV